MTPINDDDDLLSLNMTHRKDINVNNQYITLGQWGNSIFPYLLHTHTVTLKRQ